MLSLPSWLKWLSCHFLLKRIAKFNLTLMKIGRKIFDPSAYFFHQEKHQAYFQINQMRNDKDMDNTNIGCQIGGAKQDLAFTSLFS